MVEVEAAVEVVDFVEEVAQGVVEVEDGVVVLGEGEDIRAILCNVFIVLFLFCFGDNIRHPIKGFHAKLTSCLL